MTQLEQKDVQLNDEVRFAKAYPFSIPGHSYLYQDGGFTRLSTGEAERAGRVPVLAAGSNQSPQQLARKYGPLGADAGPIPAQRGLLQDFDVVYAAHLARYGSFPATFQGSPGTAVTVFVLWLDDLQLKRMHETEGNYTYDHLHGIEIRLDDGAGTITEAFAYSSKIGCINFDGDCAGLAEIPAEGRRFPTLTQIEAQGALRDRLDPGRPLDHFVARNIESEELRRAHAQELRADALPLSFRRRVIATI